MGGVYRIQTFFGFLYFFYIYKAPYVLGNVAFCGPTGDETFAKQLAKLYTKCIRERRIPKTWKQANMVIFVKKGIRKDIENYIPICLLSNMYKLFTKS